jgi:hypothetical protein
MFKLKISADYARELPNIYRFMKTLGFAYIMTPVGMDWNGGTPYIDINAAFEFEFHDEDHALTFYTAFSKMVI